MAKAKTKEEVAEHRQEQQPGRVRGHAGHRDQALVEAVADRAGKHGARHLRRRNHRHDQRRQRQRIAEALRDVQRGVHVDGGNDDQGRAVPQRDEPERRRVHRLLQREVVAGGRGVDVDGDGRGGGLGVAVDAQAHVFGPALDDGGYRQADRHDREAGDERRRTPAPGLERERDDRHHDAAERAAHLHGRERTGALLVEPVDQHHGQREEAAEAAADGDARGSRCRTRSATRSG